MHRDLHQANRLSWNAATQAHNSHKRDQARFLRDGGSTLFPEEVALLGGLEGCRLVHLQCNSGQDTLSLARRGAVVTGVDISDTAIAFAEQLAVETAIPGRFVRADIFDWFAQTISKGARFDRVFASYGAIPWLSDLQAWGAGISQILAPGGRFVLVEFHPAAMIFDAHWAPRYDYFSDKATKWEDGVGDYVAESGVALTPSGFEKGDAQFTNPHPCHEFTWSLGEVVTALASADLVVAQLVEYPYANGWQGFEGMRDSGGRRMVPPEGFPNIPLMYGLVAIKPNS